MAKLLRPDLLQGSDYVKGYEIDGLRTPYVIWRENYLDSINRTLSIFFSFPVVGWMSVEDLLEIVSVELRDRGVIPVAVYAEGKIIPADCRFSYINKQYMGQNGFITLDCVTERVEEEGEDEAVDDLF
uniref:Uncharacterized protein n=1 Tax=Aegilops tauschii TaxID=37682 RepID=R7WC23_AEGTA